MTVTYGLGSYKCEIDGKMRKHKVDVVHGNDQYTVMTQWHYYGWHTWEQHEPWLFKHYNYSVCYTWTHDTICEHSKGKKMQVSWFARKKRIHSSKITIPKHLVFPYRSNWTQIPNDPNFDIIIRPLPLYTGSAIYCRIIKKTSADRNGSVFGQVHKENKWDILNGLARAVFKRNAVESRYILLRTTRCIQRNAFLRTTTGKNGSLPVV